MGQKGLGPLSGARVLDLSDAIGAYCSKLLADLGADVIKAEHPGGDDLRRRPPFVEGDSGTGDSLVFAGSSRQQARDHARCRAPRGLARSRGDRSLLRRGDCVAVGTSASRRIRPGGPEGELGRARRCDRIDHSFRVDRTAANSRMTPFLSFAMSGGMHWVGEQGGPPLVVPGQLQWDEAGINAALGVVAALLARDRVKGQLLDLSVHEVGVAKDFLLERYDVGRPDEWGRMVGVGIPPTGVWFCADGPFAIAAHQEHHWQAFLSMLDQPAALSEPSLNDPLVRRDIFDGLQEVISGLMVDRHRLELFAKGQAVGLPCAPVNTPSDFVRDIQPRARGIFERVTTANGDIVTIPWRWCHSNRPLLHLRRPPPGLGQHNVEILIDELGFSPDVLKEWQEAGIV